MSVTAKHLSDALTIISREVAATEQLIRVAMTDITDSDDNFSRRVKNLEDDRSELIAERDRLNKQIGVLDAELTRMAETRAKGHDTINQLKDKLKTLSLNEATVKLAVLQLEVANTT